ncbi:LANO_0E05556g1_1 [Lachancea nothofagi CBS 11611]|uniref:LANO_0E05556g1_1 n=1 Tax=Lachancea nothofagi CBS 11611 TaxID=1266666 RepID=A0A1G4JTI1_9SACH|nr:LANO_0E05556g1_1 [Lachancea nothofagi CBS 11611]
MSSHHAPKDHGSNIFKTMTSLPRPDRKPLAPKSINISQLVAAKRSSQIDNNERPVANTHSSLSDFIVKSKPKPLAHDLKSVAGLFGTGRPFEYTKSRSKSRPRKRPQPCISSCQKLVYRVMKSVNALETSLRLQRHRSLPAHFDIMLQVKSLKILSPTETLAVATGAQGQELLILHGQLSIEKYQQRDSWQFLLNSKSSLTLYPGLTWFFEWQVI